jgi:hypothetical protein
MTEFWVKTANIFGLNISEILKFAPEVYETISAEICGQNLCIVVILKFVHNYDFK